MPEADHLGVWAIKAPADMPLTQIAMLQATIREAWRNYDGDSGDTEAFWKFLAVEHS